MVYGCTIQGLPFQVSPSMKKCLGVRFWKFKWRLNRKDPMLCEFCVEWAETSGVVFQEMAAKCGMEPEDVGI